MSQLLGLAHWFRAKPKSMSFCAFFARKWTYKPDGVIWSSSVACGSFFRRDALELGADSKESPCCPPRAAHSRGRTSCRDHVYRRQGKTKKETRPGKRGKSTPLRALGAKRGHWAPYSAPPRQWFVSSALPEPGRWSVRLTQSVDLCRKVAGSSAHDGGGEGLRRPPVDHPRARIVWRL